LNKQRIFIVGEHGGTNLLLDQDEPQTEIELGEKKMEWNANHGNSKGALR
jgi:hypothetical protein